MKRNNNKKGFTIVELVIVIAVIAILAGVLIPTFAGIITKANDSAALQQAAATYKESLAYAKNASWDDKDEATVDAYVIFDLYVFEVNDNALNQAFTKKENDAALTTFKTTAKLYESEAAADGAGLAVGTEVFVRLNIEDNDATDFYVPYTTKEVANANP